MAAYKIDLFRTNCGSKLRQIRISLNCEHRPRRANGGAPCNRYTDVMVSEQLLAVSGAAARDQVALAEAMIAAATARVIRELRANDGFRSLVGPSGGAAPVSPCADPCFGQGCPKVRHVETQIEALVRKALGKEHPAVTFAIGGLAPWQLRKVVADVDARLDQTISVESMAEVAGLSPKHFTRAFRQSTGISPHHWIVLQRIERARHLLVETDEPVCVIAAMCGFADQSHLTAVYRRVIGTTPGKVRQLKAQQQGYDMAERGMLADQSASATS